MPPSPRTASVTSRPATPGGHTIPVGWNWTNSMSIELGARLVGERVAVAGALPRVRRDPPALPGAAGGEHDRRRREDDELAGRAPVAERAADAVAVLEQPRDRALHEDVDALSGRPCPAACGSAPGRCGRRRARGACRCARRTRAATSCRRACGRRRRPTARARARGRAPPCACSSAMRQLFRYLPPNIVSWKCDLPVVRRRRRCRAPPRSPPSAITVCALPSSDLQTSAGPRARARRPRSRRAARRRRRRSRARRSRARSTRAIQRILGSSKTPAAASRT